MKQFIEYVESLDFPQDAKDRLVDEKLLDSHHLYLNLIPYLSPAFPNVCQADLEQLNLGSYLYFRFLLLLDDTIDTMGEGGNKLEALLNINMGYTFFEKSVRELSQLYGNDKTFWDRLKGMKQQYLDTVLIEKKISIQRSAINPELFEKVAVGKSAVCLMTVYALGVLDKSSPYKEILVECLSELHIALQYLDDIEDFKNDIQEGQWTYPQFLVGEYLQAKAIDTDDPRLLHKHLYLSGIAQNVIRRAEKHLIRSVALAQEANLTTFAQFLEKERDMCDFHCKEIDNLLHKTHEKVSKSTTFTTQNNLVKGIDLGLSFIINNLNEKHQWSDFLTSAGQATTWTTAYVGMNLAEMDSDMPVLKLVYDTLVNQENIAFNVNEIQDGDSTNFVVGFQQMLAGEVSEHHLKKWFEFMNNDGGWVTYRDESSLKKRLELGENADVRGWVMAHACVTAASAYVLAKIPSLEKEYDLTCEYLLRLFDSDNHIKSYWWTSDIYATTWAMMALSQHKQYHRQSLFLAQWLVSQQNEQGAWVNEAANAESAFYTALAIKALILCENEEYEGNINKGINWLLAHQTTDGSWATTRILRIPATDVLRPEAVTQWRNSSFGVDCIVDDHNRLFTTSTVVNVLNLKNTYKNVTDKRLTTHTV
jgi:hypothetical protein